MSKDTFTLFVSIHYEPNFSLSDLGNSEENGDQNEYEDIHEHLLDIIRGLNHIDIDNIRYIINDVDDMGEIDDDVLFDIEISFDYSDDGSSPDYGDEYVLKPEQMLDRTEYDLGCNKKCHITHITAKRIG